MTFRRIMLVRPTSRCGWGYMWAPLAINLEYIAAYIEKDVEAISIVNQEFHDTDIEQALDEFKPDFVGVTMSATEHVSGLAVCRAAKKRGITTAVGGFNPTALPEYYLTFSEVDMVMCGESEATMKELVTSGSPEGIDGISFRKDGKVVHNAQRIPIHDLDSMPFPARHLRLGTECDAWLKNGQRHMDQVHTSRGCWGKCTFCCEPSMSHSKQRYREPEPVFEEIKQVYKLHGEEPLFILIGDPHFMGNADKTERLCDLLIKEGMDIHFTAMVRADTVAKNPRVVAKMIKAGVIGYCMGLESPNMSDLRGTKKGISNKIQAQGVRELRKNHAIAGGTFVMGLPGQTEAELLTFPEYARKLGMINAAFAVATPQAGTEFYRDMDPLIHQRDWTFYDQMHSVFKHENFPGDHLERLLAHNLGRFYAPDIFIDDMIESQYRIDKGRKITSKDVVKYVQDRLNFITTVGGVYRPEDGKVYGKIFLRAQANPFTRKRTKRIGLHNMMELGPFLRVFGNQKIQATMHSNGKPFITYVIKFSKKKLEYIDATRKPHKNPTLTFDIDQDLMKMSKSKVILSLVGPILKRGQFLTLCRLLLAVFVNHIAVTKSNKIAGPMTLPKEYAENGMTMSGWGNEKYLKTLKGPAQLEAEDGM